MITVAQRLLGRNCDRHQDPVSGGCTGTVVVDPRQEAIWKHQIIAILSGVAAANVFVIWLWLTRGSANSLPWLAGFTVIEGLRLLVCRTFHRKTGDDYFWAGKSMLILGSALSGALWGFAAAVYLVGPGAEISPVMLSLMVAVLGAAMIGATGFFAAAAGFMAPALLIPAAAHVLAEGPTNLALGVLALGTLAIGLWASRQIERLTLEAVRLTREKMQVEAEAAAQTFRSERYRDMLSHVLEGTDAAIVVLDQDLRLMVWNTRFTDQCGDVGVALERGLPYEHLIREFNSAGEYSRVSDEGAMAQYFDRLKHYAGPNPLKDEYTHFDGRVFEIYGWRTGDGCWVLTYTNITDGRKAAAEAVIHMSHHDSLTGLPNRARLRRELARSLVRAREDGSLVGVMVVDINDFKSINDTQGHETGDALLVDIARTLSDRAGDDAIVSRFAADEFAVVLPAGSIEELDRAARALLDGVKTRRVIKNKTIRVAASIGMASFPADGDDPERLLRFANVALHRAQLEGRDTIVRYEGSMFMEAEARAQLEHDILHSLDNDHFSLHFQPQLDLRTDIVVGVESLLRWHHPERGWVSPASFIAVAELSKLIIPLTEKLLETACRQAVQWSRDGLPPIRVAFNLSPLHIKEGGVDRFVRRVLAETGLTADRLELEITETAMANDSAKVLDSLAELDALGVTLAIDDFGTGYSSMSYLRQLPVDTVKIDRSFVAELTTDDSAAAIVETVINLAHTLGLTVTAEGIETSEQLAWLRKLGCDYGQGYFLARPMPADLFATWLRNGEWDGHGDDSPADRPRLASGR